MGNCLLNWIDFLFRLTLDITERNEAEEFEESLLRAQQPIRQPKLHKAPKFKHMKGAPDADSIFN